MATGKSTRSALMASAVAGLVAVNIGARTLERGGTASRCAGEQSASGRARDAGGAAASAAAGARLRIAGGRLRVTIAEA